MSREKKPFKETKVGKFLSQNVPEALNALDGIPAVATIKGVLKLAGVNLPSEKQEELDALLLEYEKEERKDYLADVANARNREIEMAKAGANDHLMYVAGYTALGTFLIMVYAVIWVPESKENPLFHQLMGIIEGVALTVFAYYFGSSKGSADKTKLLK